LFLQKNDENSGRAFTSDGFPGPALHYLLKKTGEKQYFFPHQPKRVHNKEE